MGVQYRVDIANAAGTKIDEITDFRRVAVARQILKPGRIDVELPASHRAIASLSDKCGIRVYRRWAEQGIDWYALHEGLFRDEVYETLEDSQQIYTLVAPGPLSILGWSANAYPADTANKTSWSSVRAETIMKNLVTNNATSAATTGNGRDRTRLSSGTLNGLTLTVQSDAAGGNLLSYTSARGNLLSELEAVWDAGAGGDFDLIRTGPTTYEFRFYAGQRGTDRTATVTFAETFGTMGRPKLVRSRAGEATVAIAAGQGQKARRAIAVRTGTNYSTANDIERVVDGRQAATTAALQAAGDAALTKWRSRAQLSFTPLQTPARLLDRDYFLGDRVASSYANTTFTHQVWADQHTYTPKDGEQVGITLRDY